MTAAMTTTGVLLTVGPVLGAIPIAHPALVRVWGAPRERYLGIIGAHRRAWYLLNAGFAFATLVTSAGLAILATGYDAEQASGGILLGTTLVYSLAGVLWLIVLAARAVCDPLLAVWAGEGQPAGPAETILRAMLQGLFGAFVITTAITLMALAYLLATDGVVAIPVALVAGALAAIVLAIQLRTGDCIPALLYVPTMVMGGALLAGWT
jgi:hypothetical protein